jgi:hypothetical protein
VRIDGKPTQHHIAYLGGITESAIAIAAQRRFFWDALLKRLNRLSKRVSKQERKRIVAAVAQKVAGPPTKAERKRLDRQRLTRPAVAVDVTCAQCTAYRTGDGQAHPS